MMTVDTEPRHSLPEIDFSTFVLSLGSSALIHLGEIPDTSGASAKDLSLAKQTIDIIAMLQDKTKGNLDAAEENLLRSLLYDLRVKYVDAQKKG
jgi:hypothetical protein